MELGLLRPQKPLALFALIFLPGAAVALLWATTLTAPAERFIYDRLLRTRPVPADAPVVLVAIDEPTFAALGHDPSRAELAEAITALWARHPALIGIDLLLLSPKDDALDAALEKAIASADCVLACSPAQGSYPISRFRKEAAGLGSIDLILDQDGILRGLPPPYTAVQEGRLVIERLPFALECARRMWYPDSAPELELGQRGLKVGSHSYPLSEGRWLIPYRGGDGTLARLSFIDLLHGQKALQDLSGKVVLIGNTRAAAQDYKSVPLPAAAGKMFGMKTISTHSMAGVEVHGQALAALLQNQSIASLSPKAASWLLGLLALAAAVLAVFPLRPFASALLWTSGACVLLASGIVGIRHGLALPLFSMVLSWGAYAGSSFAYHRYKDFSARRDIERLFGRYVSPNIARRLLADPSMVHAGGRKKILTILFSDIRGFTSLSEKLPPEKVTEILNLYFTEMMAVLFAHDGTYDKFIGDALLAFFGDPADQPDHAARALECAVSMQERAAALRARFAQAGLPALHIGIAINTGPVVVGNHGSKESWTYTVIGDAVNLASRLQGLAQHDEVILSEQTASAIDGLEERYVVEKMEPVMVKGKSAPIPIMRVLGRKKEAEHA
jgi:adenylate cyclase